MSNPPTDGRMTSFDPVPATLVGDELLWIVQPGNVDLGILYKVTLTVLAEFLGQYSTPVLVSALPTPAAGARGFVTDANTTLTLGIGTAVVGGGSNFSPVYSDGADWFMG